jgi:anti-sigma B factor antagonist
MTNFVTAVPVLRVERECRDGVEIVTAKGDIDLSTVGGLERALVQAVAAAEPSLPVILDCTQVGFLGSCGLSVFLAVHERALMKHTRLLIVAPQRAVRRPLRVTGFDEALSVYDSVPDALRSAASFGN